MDGEILRERELWNDKGRRTTEFCLVVIYFIEGAEILSEVFGSIIVRGSSPFWQLRIYSRRAMKFLKIDLFIFSETNSI